MWDFNVIVTLAGSTGRYFQLIRELNRFGEFHKTEFLGVIVGRVAETAAFFQAVDEERRQGGLAELGRVVPLDGVFLLRPETFTEQLQQAVLPYLEALSGKSFYVRLERRGHKRRIISPEVERGLDAWILAALERAGKSARIDFEHPDAVLVVETVGDRCGIGLLAREQLERFDFVRVG